VWVLKLTATAVLVIPLLCTDLSAQSAHSTTLPPTFHVRVTITDPLGAVIPGAKITFLSEHLSKTESTDRLGVYEADLPLGTYRMTVVRRDLRPYRRPLFRVASPASLTFNLIMPLDKHVHRRFSNNSGEPLTPEQREAISKVPPPYYGEEFFPARSKDGVPFQLYVRYERRTVIDDRYDYTGKNVQSEDPVFVAYNLFSLEANEVIYDARNRTIEARGNVIVANESGTEQRADSITFKIGNGQATPIHAGLDH
jgi:hypothetical protein